MLIIFTALIQQTKKIKMNFSNKYSQIFIVIVLSITTVSLRAQAPKKPFTVNLSEDGKKYIKFGANAQIWGRYTELNNGSRVGNDLTTDAYDIVIRRLRLQAMGMLADKVFFHFQLGQNNINFLQNNNPSNSPLSIMDALGEYHFSNQFQVGGGINGWGAGTTRYSAQSSSSQLTVDAPIYQQNNISGTFGNRNLTIYAKGMIDKWSYRIGVTNPYRNSSSAVGTSASVSNQTPNAQFLGMLTYQFLDKESNMEPYNKATYLGAKNVFNIGIGYMFQKDAMWRKSSSIANDTIFENMGVLGIDVFYERPLSAKGNTLTAYAAFNNCNYGENYLRMLATPNPASSGTGSGFYGIGTGNIFYSQIGYLFPKANKEKAIARVQAYTAIEYASLNALNSPMTMIEAGVNYYITGTLGPKFTLGYQNRSVFEPKTGEQKLFQTTRNHMLTAQLQVNF